MNSDESSLLISLLQISRTFQPYPQASRILPTLIAIGTAPGCKRAYITKKLGRPARYIKQTVHPLIKRDLISLTSTGQYYLTPKGQTMFNPILKQIEQLTANYRRATLKRLNKL